MLPTDPAVAGVANAMKHTASNADRNRRCMFQHGRAGSDHAAACNRDGGIHVLPPELHENSGLALVDVIPCLESDVRTCDGAEKDARDQEL